MKNFINAVKGLCEDGDDALGVVLIAGCIALMWIMLYAIG